MPYVDKAKLTDFLKLAAEIGDDASVMTVIYRDNQEELDDLIADYIHNIRLSALALVAEVDELKLKYIRKPHTTTPEEV